MPDQSDFEQFVDTHFPPGTREVVKKMKEDATNNLAGEGTEAQVAFINVMQEAQDRSAPSSELTWTDEAPTQSGYYYHKEKRDDDTFSLGIVKVAEVSGFFFLHSNYVLEGGDVNVQMVGGEWAGPIPRPAD